MAKNVSCKITLNRSALKKLEKAQTIALEKTAEFIHTDVVQSQTIPFDVPTEKEKVAGKVTAGTLQNEKHFVDTSQSKNGKVSVCVEGPYARRLYFHPEYHFDKGENPHAGAKWFEPYKDGGKKSLKVKAAFKQFYRRETGV